MDQLLNLLPHEIPRLDLRGLIDILIVGALIYGLLMLIKDTTAVMLMRGLAILIIGGALISNVLNLPVLGWLIRNSIPALLVAIPILFQPELRRALEQLGHLGGIRRTSISPQAHLIDVIAIAARRLSERRWGALVVLERETALGEYAASGVELDAILSVDLLEQVFHPNTRLHDGAVVVRGDRLLAAGCLLPLAETLEAGQNLGTRHRAAVGITTRTDAIVVVVSEETGQISIANHGRLVRHLDEVKLRKVLSILYRPALGDEVSRWLWPGSRPPRDPDVPSGAAAGQEAGTRVGGFLAPIGLGLGLLFSLLRDWLGRGGPGVRG